MSEPTRQPDGKRRTAVVALLMAVMVISVLDKSIFAFAGVHIIEELKLTPEQFGFIGSAFFFLYSLSGVLVGFLANRYPSRWILTGMSVVWMLAQLMVAVSSSFFALVGSRLLLGAGCGPGTAVTQHACFKWFSPRERVLPSALIQVAIMLGAICGALSLPLAIEHMGWRTAYLLLAGLGLVWLVLWLAFGREGQHDDSADTSEDDVGQALPYRRLLLNGTFVFITLIAFCSYLPTALIYSWVPVYLQKGLGLTPLQSGYVVMAATLSVIILNLAASTLSQRALKRGASVYRAMVVPPMLACVVAGVAMVIMGFFKHSLGLTLALYLVGGTLVNLLPAFANSIVAFIAPNKQRGSMLAIHIGLMTSAGMLAPHLVGEAISWHGGDTAAGFEQVVGAFGVALIVSALLGLRLINPERKRQQLLSTPTPASDANAPQMI